MRASKKLILAGFLSMTASNAFAIEFTLNFVSGAFFTSTEVHITNNDGEIIQRSYKDGKVALETMNFAVKDADIGNLLKDLEALGVFGWEKQYPVKPHPKEMICEGGWMLEIVTAQKAIKTTGACAEPATFREVQVRILAIGNGA